MKREWLAALVLAVVMLASAAQASDYVRVRFLPAKEPALYLQLDEDAMRLATTPEGLATAAPVAAQPAERGDQQGEEHRRQFHVAALPALPLGATSAAASFDVMHTRSRERLPTGFAYPTDVMAQFMISTPGANGDTWTYETSAFAQVRNDAQKPTAANAPIIVIGDLSRPVLVMESQVKGRKVGIAARLWAGTPEKVKDADGKDLLIGGDSASQVMSLRRNGRPASVHVDIIAPPGKTIKSEQGDLTKFGAGWSGPYYSVRVANKGTYTAKATVETPAGPVSAKTTFVVR